MLLFHSTTAAVRTQGWDRRTDRRTDGQTDRQIDRQTDRRNNRAWIPVEILLGNNPNPVILSLSRLTNNPHPVILHSAYFEIILIL